MAETVERFFFYSFFLCSFLFFSCVAIFAAADGGGDGSGVVRCVLYSPLKCSIATC